jgi:uncharacterized membrane protein
MLRINQLIVVSSTLLLVSVSSTLTIQAQQGIRAGTVRSAGSSRSESSRWDPKFVEFDPPGATKAVLAACGGYCGTFAYANNAAGTIVGAFTDQYVVPHAFIRAPDGHFLSFDAPGAGLGHGLDEGTVAYAISAAGAVVGQYEDAKTIYHGFVREPNGSFSTFSAPGAGTKPGVGQGTYAWDINGYGDTAGIYIDSSSVYHGFLRSRDHHVTTFDPPGSVLTYVCEETCLSDAGIAGFYYDKNNVEHAFLREPDGKITEFNAPGAGKAAGQGSQAASINADGTIAGEFTDSKNVVQGFVRYRNGSYVIGEAPGAGNGPGQGTYPFSINAFNAITGIVVDKNSVLHGFERFQNGALTTFNAPGASTATAFVGTRPSTNNVRGEVTGWFTDTTGLNHGFLWRP